MTLIQSGSCGAASRAAAIAAFAFSVSKIVSISSRSTPPSARPRICSAYDSTTWSNVCVRKPGSSTLRAQRQRDVERPDRAGDEPVRPRRLARDSRAGDVHVVDRVLEPVVGLADRRRRERVRRRDVGAGARSTRRAPTRTMSGCVRFSRSGSFLTSRVWSRNRSPRKSASVRPRFCSSTPHAPSSTRIRSLGDPAYLVCDVSGHRLFRRLVTRSPSCSSKLSGMQCERSRTGLTTCSRTGLRRER